MFSSELLEYVSEDASSPLLLSTYCVDIGLLLQLSPPYFFFCHLTCGIMFFYWIYCVQSIKGPGTHQLTPRAYCEIPVDIGVSLRKEGGETNFQCTSYGFQKSGIPRPTPWGCLLLMTKKYTERGQKNFLLYPSLDYYSIGNLEKYKPSRLSLGEESYLVTSISPK